MAKKLLKESEELIEREYKSEETITKNTDIEEENISETNIEEENKIKPVSIDTLKQLSINKNISIATSIQLLLIYDNNITKIMELYNKAKTLSDSKCISIDEAISYLSYISKIK